MDGQTAATRWRGERMDYELGVWGLCNQEERARRAKDPSARDARDGDSLCGNVFLVRHRAVAYNHSLLA